MRDKSGPGSQARAGEERYRFILVKLGNTDSSGPTTCIGPMRQLVSRHGAVSVPRPLFGRAGRDDQAHCSDLTLGGSSSNLQPMPMLSNPRHEAFCHALVTSGNASAAYRESGGNGRNADVIANQFNANEWYRRANR